LHARSEPAYKRDLVVNILVTGGAGFIGSHFVRAALEHGFGIVVLDDLSTGIAAAVPPGVPLICGDIADRDLVCDIMHGHAVDVVAHFAGKIDVNESIAEPRRYFEANLAKSLLLLDSALDAGVGTFLFSSSAAVYGASEGPLREDSPLAPVNPYGMSKLAVEQALASYGQAYGLKWAALRYFNAAGAHPDGTLREAHHPETHLIPLAIDAALGARPPLTVFGTDYPTRDGTCVRDYVHVCDLADAHVAAIDALRSGTCVGAVNLGTGSGFTVMEVLEACGCVAGAEVRYQLGPRRPGDPPVLVAQAEKAKRVLSWTPKRSDLSTIIEDALRSRRVTSM
jgi:UDP-glucose-4-epimerase GalE